MIDRIPSDNQSITKSGKILRTRIVITIGVLLTVLFFNFGVVSATNSTDLNVTIPNSTLAEPSVIANITLNETSVPTVLIPNTTLIPDTTLITPVPAIIPNVTLNVTPLATTLVPDTTLVTAIPTAITNTTLQTTTVPNTTLITAVQAAATTANPTQNIPTMSTRDAIEQYTLRAENSITQEDKEQAAARYKKIREAYLLQGTGASQVEGGARIAAYSIAAVPALNPGGVPHYFGPFPNWANSPMPKGVIANITVDSGGAGYSANPTISVTDVYFTGSGATATATVSQGAITGITVTYPGYGYSAPVIVITDVGGSGAAATFDSAPDKGSIKNAIALLRLTSNSL